MRLARIGVALAGACLWAMTAGPLAANDNGSVDAQVTVATPCIEITSPASGSLDFGTLPFSHDFTTSSSNRGVSYTNCGSSAERVFGRGTDATGGTGGLATWQLVDFNGCTGGPNRYSIDVLAPNQYGGDGTVLWLSTLDQELETVQASTAGTVDNLSLAMPCVGSDGVGGTMTFRVTFTATF
jgi:hypothetical protein